MRLRPAAAATALLVGALSTFAMASPAVADSFADAPTVEIANSATVSAVPAGTKTTCFPGGVFSTSCAILSWAGLHYWFLSRTDNGSGFHVAVYGNSGALLGDASIGGLARYIDSLSVDSTAQQVTAVGQGEISTTVPFDVLKAIVAEDSLTTTVSLSPPSTPVLDSHASADLGVILSSPSYDPGGEIVVETSGSVEIGRETVPAGYLGSSLSISIDASLLNAGTSIVAARYVPPSDSPLKASTSSNLGVEVVKTYSVSFVDPDGAPISSQRVPEGEAATAPTVVPPSGYLLGWDTDFSAVTQDLTVQAVWQVDPVVDHLTLTAFDAEGNATTTANQGEAVTLHARAFNAVGIDLGDVTDEVEISSSVPTDVITGDSVRFPSASPHTITVVHTASGVRAQLVIEVTAAELARTGIEQLLLGQLGVLLLGSGCLLLLSRLRRRVA